MTAHRLADAAAGRLGEREQERVAQHVAGCDRCRTRAGRIERARAAMSDIAELAAPDLGWDQIGVRLYWESSSAKHRAMRDQQRPWWRRRVAFAVAVPALGAAAVAVALVAWPRGDEATSAPVAAAPAAAPVAAGQPAVADGLTGVITFASGPVTVDGKALSPAELFDRPIAAGARVATGDGRVVVQFGAGSGFALAPRSTATLARFDERAVEIQIEGGVEVAVAPLRPEQRFDVVAGRHRVGVRGTAFQVDHRGGALDVTCAHGKVVVSDGAGEVAVSAGEALRLLPDVLLARARRMVVDPAELAELEATLAAPLLPAWTAPRALLDTSSTLDVGAAAGRGVRIDGVDVGDGTFSMRVMSGRHHLEVAGADGRWGTGTWFDAAPGQHQHAPLDPAPLAGAAAPRAARRLRTQQLTTALEDRTAHCMEPLEKRDLVAGSFIVFDVGINADGTQGHLNVIDTNVPPEVASCLRRAVDAVELPAGPAATVRHRLAF
ncbi:MAG TPA: FecR domain-containing protein [Kofleriaceae bacterium]|nr:FecR domain-containing protein [Kofleriaceae bacterium]